MDFINSISFPKNSWTFIGHFCHHFWVDATAKQQESHPKVMAKMVKKCTTDQRFIRKRNTTYKIHTLIWKKSYMFNIQDWWLTCDEQVKYDYFHFWASSWSIKTVAISWRVMSREPLFWFVSIVGGHTQWKSLYISCTSKPQLNMFLSL